MFMNVTLGRPVEEDFVTGGNGTVVPTGSLGALLRLGLLC